MYCPNCGREIPDGSKFCPYCGAFIRKNAIELPLGKKIIVRQNIGKTKSHKKLILVLVIIFLFIASLFIFAYPQVAPIVFKGISNSYIEKANQQLFLLQSNNETQPPLDSAVSDLNTAIRLNPKNIEARENLAAINAIKGDMKEVDKQVDEILKLDPNDEYAKVMKSLLSEKGAP